MNHDRSSKVCSFWSCASLALAPVNTRVHGRVLSLSYQAIVMFEKLIHEIMGITDVWNKIAHDQNEQTILSGQLTKPLIQDMDYSIALNRGFVLDLNYEIRLLKLHTSGHIKVYSF